MIEKLKQLASTDGSERAVSPVIGVILMVAITVILAAVIGSFVLGLGDQLNQPGPQVSLGVQGQADTTADANNTLIRINHNSGPSLQLSKLQITIRDAGDNSKIAQWTPATTIYNSSSTPHLALQVNGQDPVDSGSLSAGGQLQILEVSEDNAPVSGDTVKITIRTIDSDSTLVSTTVTID